MVRDTLLARIERRSLSCVASSPRAVTATEAPTSRSATEQDIVYTKAGAAELKLDLARPAEGDGPFPAVLVIHGGAWRQGNKADVRPIWPSSPSADTWRSRPSTGSVPRTPSRPRSTT